MTEQWLQDARKAHATLIATLPPLSELGEKVGVHCRTCDSITHVDPRYHKDT